MTVPMVDAHSGRVLAVGDIVEGHRILAIETGVFTANVAIQDVTGYHPTRWVEAPIKWFPRLTYGPNFPVGGLRAIVLPT